MAETAWIGDTHTKVGRLGSAHNLYTALPRTTAAYLTLCNGRLTAEECYRRRRPLIVDHRQRLLRAAPDGFLDPRAQRCGWPLGLEVQTIVVPHLEDLRHQAHAHRVALAQGIVDDDPH
jgi:hypothetical protein